MASTIASYLAIANDLPRALERTANAPRVARETAHYLDTIAKVATVDDFLADRRVAIYALTAFGLGEAGQTIAFVRTILTGGASERGRLACHLTESRYREFAAVFDFARLGADTTKRHSAQAGVVEKYVRQMLEEQAGAQSEGVRLALYFSRLAPDLTNAYQILADPALLDVVQTTLGLSPLTSAADIDRQADLLAMRVDFSDFQDRERLRAFVQRFAVLWDIGNPQPVTAATQIAVGHPLTLGIGADALMTLHDLKSGR